MGNTHQSPTSFRYGRMQFWMLSHVRACFYAFGKIIRQPLANLMTIFVLAIALAIPSAFFSLTQGVKSLLPPWQQSAVINLYLKDNVTSQAIQQLQQSIQQMPDVAKVTVITPAAALASLNDAMQITTVTQQLPTNPLPTTLVVTPSLSIHTQATLQQLYQQLSQLPAIDSAQCAFDWVQHLLQILKLLTTLVYMVGLIFVVAVFLIISNTIRLTLQKEKHDILVMRFLGANKAMILRPILYQGVWLGVAAGMLAIIMMVVMGWIISAPVNQLLALYQLHASATVFFKPIILLWVLIVATVLAWFGTRLSVMRAVSGPEVLD